MNAKQRAKNRQTAETLHYAIQRATGKNHYRLKRWQPQQKPAQAPERG